MTIKDLIQSVLDTVLFSENVPVFYQRKTGPDANEYIVFSINGDSHETFADDETLIKNARITIRYYYRSDLLDTQTGRQAIEAREDLIELTLDSAGFGIPDGRFDAGDVDDIGYYVTVFECEYWRVL